MPGLSRALLPALVGLSSFLGAGELNLTLNTTLLHEMESVDGRKSDPASNPDVVTLTISRATVTNSALVVSLAATNSSRLRQLNGQPIPATVTIPANKSTTLLLLQVANTDAFEGQQVSTLTISATGKGTAAASVTMRDFSYAVSFDENNNAGFTDEPLTGWPIECKVRLPNDYYGAGTAAQRPVMVYCAGAAGTVSLPSRAGWDLTQPNIATLAWKPLGAVWVGMQNFGESPLGAESGEVNGRNHKKLLDYVQAHAGISKAVYNKLVLCGFSNGAGAHLAGMAYAPWAEQTRVILQCDGSTGDLNDTIKTNLVNHFVHVVSLSQQSGWAEYVDTAMDEIMPASQHARWENTTLPDDHTLTNWMYWYNNQIVAFTKKALAATPPKNLGPEVKMLMYDTTYDVGQAITLTAYSTDADGSVTSVKWYQINGAKQTQIGGTDTTPTAVTIFTTSWTATTPGSVSVKAFATDNDGTSTWSAPITLTIAGSGNQGPAVSVNVPASANTGTSITLAATATDSDGTVSSVKWYSIVGNTQTQIGTADPTGVNGAYATTWTTPSAAGSITIKALATDNDGDSTWSSADVLVVNDSTPPTPSELKLVIPSVRAGVEAYIGCNAPAAYNGKALQSVQLYMVDPKGKFTYVGQDANAPYAIGLTVYVAGKSFTLRGRASYGGSELWSDDYEVTCKP